MLLAYMAPARLGRSCSCLSCPTGPLKFGRRRRARCAGRGSGDQDGYLVVEASVADQFGDLGSETVALGRATIQQFEQYIKLNKKIASEVLNAVEQIEETDKIADMIASHLAIKIAEKQELLETLDIHSRLERVFGYMEGRSARYKLKSGCVTGSNVRWKRPSANII